MKYITSTFSNNMWQDPKNLLLEEELSEKQFKKESSDGYSCVSAEDVAELLNVPINKETVKARHNDTIYNVTKEHGSFKFYKVRVMPNTLPCKKECCEELI